MCRKGKELSERDRYFIEKSLKRKMSHKEIADVLGVTRQCIDYEIKKGTVLQRDTNLVDKYIYKADFAHRISRQRKSLTGRNLKYIDTEILKTVEKGLKDKDSPYAVIERYSLRGKICETTIYSYIRKRLFPDICYRDLPYMKACKGKQIRQSKIYIPKEKIIDSRPEHSWLRETVGDWEMDTVYSGRSDNSCLLVLTERCTRLNINRKIVDRSQKSVCEALRTLESKVGVNSFKEIFKTITCDNGVEFKDYETLERTKYSNKQKRTFVYYAHPYRSGERGSNENQNKMIRRKIPKGDDIGLYSKEDISFITSWMNNYPRKIFKGKSSLEQLHIQYNAGNAGNISQKAYKQLVEISNGNW